MPTRLALLSLFLLLSTTIFAQESINIFKDQAPNFVIEGVALNAQVGSKVTLQRVDRLKVIHNFSETTIQADGTFRIEGFVPEKAICRLRYKNTEQGYVLLIIDKGSHFKLRIDQHQDDSQCYELEGNAENIQLKEWYDSTNNSQFGHQAAIHYADTVTNAFIGYIATTNVPLNSDYIHIHLKQQERLHQQAPNNAITQAFDKRMQAHKGIQDTQIGMIAPSIVGVNPQGDTISLESYRGKHVLFNVWASWCRPCRRENPNHVTLYQKYKEQGFEFFSISLDQTQERWEKAIQEDSLMWKGHICDFQRWKSNYVDTYGVKSIPYTLLLDPEGKIIARNLRDKKLAIKLAEVFEEKSTSPTKN